MFCKPLKQPIEVLNVKIGVHEFKAEGPPAIVLIQYNAWLMAIGHSSTVFVDGLGGIERGK